jgi:tRNA-dihydrouridine synthase
MSSPDPAFRIREVPVANRLLLAPMEDVTAQPMRRIAKRIAAPGLMFTEFVSAMAIHYGATKTLRKFRVHPDERPLAIQIFGGDPEIMAETARVAETYRPDTIDINMGCWVPKVCKTGAGAALLKDPEKAQAIVAAVARAVSVPVTVSVADDDECGEAKPAAALDDLRHTVDRDHTLDECGFLLARTAFLAILALACAAPAALRC